MIIGLTGKNASGKGEVANLLQEGGFHFFSLSDALRLELQKRNLPITREHLVEIGTELRATQGPAVLALKILALLEADKNYVIDSFRHPQEVEAFRRHKDFHLIHVSALPELRFDRIRVRKRENDPTTFDAFQKLEMLEANHPDQNGQQLNATASLRDIEIENNTSIENLRERVKEAIRQLASLEKRPSWDEYFMNIAKVVALRSNCLKRKVAAVIVKDERVISTGYNGTPRGIKNCNEGGCPRCNQFSTSGTQLEECFCSHAEENAITQAAYHGVSIKQASLYTTFSPCLLCTKMIINSGIQEVIYNTTYPLADTAVRLLGQASIKVRKI